MDRELWRIVLQAVQQVSRQLAREQPPLRRPRYADWLIVAMYLWAVAHDRSQSWACDRSHYSSVFRPRGALPSISQFNRRVSSPRTQQILQRVHERLAGDLAATALSYLDGLPLRVGLASKDRDAARGHVMGGFARGYKLHAWMSEDRRIPLWSVMPLNVGEVPVAELLVHHSGEFSPRSLTLADQNYDADALHRGVAQHQGRLLLWPKGPPTLQERHPVNVRAMGPARRELIGVAHARPVLLQMVYRQRVNAEGILGNLCSYGGGLASLPAWVRRLPRVRRWVGAKIILYHARVRLRQQHRRAA